ncbi:MAG: DUF5666 domain-containing protein [Terracidiphilus sp.]|nr:DUF5666 domain-containing protein [Terracidiphilus sp.]
MRPRLLVALLFAITSSLACAQDAAGSGGMRGRGAALWGEGHGTVGTVTAIAADHFTLKTELGETYTIFYSVNTRFMKQPAGARRQGQGRANGSGDDATRTPPETIKATEIHVGDAIGAGGEVDTTAHTVGAVMVMLIDPERAKEMRAMEANYGKTWLMGRVLAIDLDNARVTLEGGPDKARHVFVADENTTFRKRREPITLGDIKTGDMVRVEGAVKDGTFAATAVTAMGPPPNGGRGPGSGNGPAGGPPQR